MSAWNSPAPYARVLERLSRHPSGVAPPGEGHSAQAIRMVQMALETDTVGDAVWSALEAVVQEGQATEVVKMVEDPNVAEDIQEHFWAHLATPEDMRILLGNEPRDTEVVELLLERMGMTAAEPMLESLEVADNRAMRRRLLTRLGRLGPAIGPMLIERLPPAPWYVQRNLLALLGFQHLHLHCRGQHLEGPPQALSRAQRMTAIFPDLADAARAPATVRQWAIQFVEQRAQ